MLVACSRLDKDARHCSAATARHTFMRIEIAFDAADVYLASFGFEQLNYLHCIIKSIHYHLLLGNGVFTAFMRHLSAPRAQQVSEETFAGPVRRM